MKPEVIGAPQVISRGDRRTAPTLSFDLLESKFHPPVARPGIVARTALVDRLAAVQAPVITVVAPPGYGKSILLAEWAARLPGHAGPPARSGDRRSGASVSGSMRSTAVRRLRKP